MKTLYICGAGNSEGVRLALIINSKQARWRQIILLDDDPAKHGRSILGVKIAGPFEMLGQAESSSEVVNMVARSAVKRWSARHAIEQYGLPFARLLSPELEVFGADLAADVIAYRNAAIGPQVTVADGSVFFTGAIAGHESKLGPGCILAPNSVINGRVELGNGVYVGTNATVLPEVKVGAWATIAAGSVATRNVPPGATVVGVPGKVVLTSDLRFKMGEFNCLPQLLRDQVQSQIRNCPLRAGLVQNLTYSGDGNGTSRQDH